MRIRDGLRVLAGAFATALAGYGCASTGAPSGWLPPARDAGYGVHGGWATVRPLGEKSDVLGELLAVQADTVFVMTGSGLRAFARADVERIRVAGYDSEWGNVALWTTLGTLSTASHGFGLVLSAPIWIIFGATSAASASFAPIRSYPEHDWTELTPYARFPQGMPPDLDRSAPGSGKDLAPEERRQNPAPGREESGQR